jgi:hypothetical protein
VHKALWHGTVVAVKVGGFPAAWLKKGREEGYNVTAPECGSCQECCAVPEWSLACFRDRVFGGHTREFMPASACCLGKGARLPWATSGQSSTYCRRSTIRTRWVRWWEAGENAWAPMTVGLQLGYS